jgi:uncharacterized protein YprB with RNaseH-like and TPR domain
MGSFGNKLSRLTGTPGHPAAPRAGSFAARRAATDEHEARSDAEFDTSDMDGAPVAAPAVPRVATGRPSLDELRDRIAHIVSRGAIRVPRPDPSFARAPVDGPLVELPFSRRDTPSGPLYVLRKRAVPGQRIGTAPLAAAASASSEMLALLALDPSLAACDPRRALFLDTETTGLGGGTGTVAFLVGLSFYDEDAGCYVIEQVLLRRLGEEAPLLEHVAMRLREASMVVTFNGKSFDLPLLATRFIMARLPRFESRPHLDLVHVARRIHKGRVASFRLVGLEAEVLGQERIGDVAGADVVACYAHYLRTGDESALLGVVEHNALDVLSTVALFGLYGEPLFGLEPTDLARAARCVARAGDDATAMDLVEHAIERGGGVVAVRARGDLAKAKGDKARALADYESLRGSVDDPDLRLQLAKLYEHHVRSPERALLAALAGTGEREEAQTKRVERLRAKVERRTERDATRARDLARRAEDAAVRALAKRTRGSACSVAASVAPIVIPVVIGAPHTSPEDDPPDDAGRGGDHGVRYAPR